MIAVRVEDGSGGARSRLLIYLEDNHDDTYLNYLKQANTMPLIF